MKGLLNFVELLIEQGADVNGYNNIRKDTPLHAACREARPDIVKLLLEHGAKSSEKDKFGRQPLHVTAFVGRDKYKCEHLECLKILLDSGAPIDTQDRSGSTALHLALIKNNAQAAETLISYGANPDINPTSGETVRELIFKQIPSLRVIFTPSCKTSEVDIERQLFRCMDEKKEEEFRTLLEAAENKGVNIGEISDGYYNLLQYACTHVGMEDFIIVLLQNPKVDPNRKCKGYKLEPILLAAMEGNHNALKIIIDHDKTDLTVKDEVTNETVLHKVARMEIEVKAENNYFESIKILLEKINKMKGNGKCRGKTNLHSGADTTFLASRNNKIFELKSAPGIEALLYPETNTNPKILDIHAKDAFGNTALQYAKRNLERGSKEAEKIVHTLLSAGAKR